MERINRLLIKIGDIKKPFSQIEKLDSLEIQLQRMKESGMEEPEMEEKLEAIETEFNAIKNPEAETVGKDDKDAASSAAASAVSSEASSAMSSEASDQDAMTSGGGRKRRKSHKSRKSRKSKKSRKPKRGKKSNKRKRTRKH